MTDKTPTRKGTRSPNAAGAGGDEPATDAPADLDFESALAELEQLVSQMEAGDLTLEASLAAFERGVKLTRQCQTALRSAELKVQQLTRNDTLEDLDLEELDDA
jgi:exodeoxyribonuclease VII small subunit